MRKYQPIWDKLKLEGTAKLAAPADKHRRIVLAVRKEKTYDLAWKFQCLESRKKYKLLDESSDSLLTFSLQEVDCVSLASITVHDL